MAMNPMASRLAVFLSVFLVFSGLLGSMIVAHGLVSKYGFQIYGGAGKAMLFGLVCLVVLVYQRGLDLQVANWHLVNGIWILALGSMGIAWYSASRLISGVHDATWPVTAHVSLIVAMLCTAVASFGPSNTWLFIRRYHRQILIASVLTILFYLYLDVVYGLWHVLAGIVLHSVAWLLRVVGVSVAVTRPNTLILRKFSITVAQYCSGIESIALFSALYIVFGVVDRKKINRPRFLMAFVPAIALLFLLNILRVFLLVVAGYYINPTIAFSLFHTYAGLAFFVLYTAAFWLICYKWLLNLDYSQ